MSAIFYMLRKEWKNRFLALFRHPGKLVVYILLVLLLVNSVVSVALTPQADLSGFVDLRILHGIWPDETNGPDAVDGVLLPLLWRDDGRNIRYCLDRHPRVGTRGGCSAFFGTGPVAVAL